jgi:hypothetical protein
MRQMTELIVGVYSLSHTKRRRVQWCAWWKTTPTADPFVAPDAWGSGLRTEDEAIEAAESAAGMTLQRIEGRWSGAWARVRDGQPPFIKRERTVAAKRVAVIANPFKVLGIATDADTATIKSAYRRIALDAHPDRGGSAAAFVSVHRAYLAAMQRRRR